MSEFKNKVVNKMPEAIQMSLAYLDEATEKGVNLTEYLILGVIYFYKEPINISQLAEVVPLDRTTISKIVKTLVEKGFALYKENPLDARQKLVVSNGPQSVVTPR